MSGKINVRGVKIFTFLFCIGIGFLLISGNTIIDILIVIAFWAFIVFVGYAIEVLGLGKYFGGKP